MQDIYHYDQEGIDENGRAYGRFDGHRHPARRSWIGWSRPACRLPASAFRATSHDGGLSH